MKMRSKKERQDKKMDMKAGIPIMEIDMKKERQKQVTRYQGYLQKTAKIMTRSKRGCRR